MFTNEIAAQGWEVTEEINDEVFFKAGRKMFFISRWDDTFRVYPVWRDNANNEWLFLGDGKVAKSFRGIKSFVQSRIK